MREREGGPRQRKKAGMVGDREHGNGVCARVHTLVHISPGIADAIRILIMGWGSPKSMRGGGGCSANLISRESIEWKAVTLSKSRGYFIFLVLYVDERQLRKDLSESGTRESGQRRSVWTFVK